MWKRRVLFYCAIQLSISTVAFGQARHLTLPELAKRSAPQPLYQRLLAELLPATLGELIPMADLIVHGRVERANTYLSEDQVELYTDYVVAPIATVLRSAAVSSQVPDATMPVVVKIWGGETILDNVQVKLEIDHLRYFQMGEELLMGLRYDTTTRKYQIIGATVFLIKDGRIQALINHPRHDPYRGMTVDQFAAEVAKLGEKR